jgi:hypothetical protein
MLLTPAGLAVAGTSLVGNRAARPPREHLHTRDFRQAPIENDNVVTTRAPERQACAAGPRSVDIEGIGRE